MRKLNDRFSIHNEELIKTSNGQAIPPEEPIFILRGRDRLAAQTLVQYRMLCEMDGCNQEHLDDIHKAILEFEQFSRQYYDRMKQPNITKGK